MTLIDMHKTCDTINHIFDQMNNSNKNFYLTGSRFFDTHTKDSDWDFYTEDCPEVRKELESWGFVLENSPAYLLDSLTNQVYVHKEADVHIQCVNNVGAKTLIKDNLLELNKKTGMLNYLSKQNKRELWQMALNLIHDTKYWESMGDNLG